jgi:hypothetical protein
LGILARIEASMGPEKALVRAVATKTSARVMRSPTSQVRSRRTCSRVARRALTASRMAV